MMLTVFVIIASLLIDLMAKNRLQTKCDEEMI